MQKGKYFFNKLSHRQKSYFRSSFREYRKFTTFEEYMNEEIPNMKMFIYMSFDLGASKKGFKYWNKVSNK